MPSPRTGATESSDLNPSATVLLLVDFINPLEFDGGAEIAAEAVAAARVTARLKRTLGDALAIYANDNYGTWRSDFPALLARCSRMAGAPGDIARVLRPRARDITLIKPRHSAFYNTPLEVLLAQLKTRRIVITGLSADNCVFFTAMDAYLRGFKVWVPQDCVAAESAEFKQRALEHMSRVLKADIRPAARHPS